MKPCNDCKNLGEKTQCKYYGIGSNYAERCKDYKEPKQTNADRIRSMNDEELADFINRKTACDCCSAKHCNSDERCEVDILQWLKSESKE